MSENILFLVILSRCLQAIWIVKKRLSFCSLHILVLHDPSFDDLLIIDLVLLFNNHLDVFLLRHNLVDATFGVLYLRKQALEYLISYEIHIERKTISPWVGHLWIADNHSVLCSHWVTNTTGKYLSKNLTILKQYSAFPIHIKLSVLNFLTQI